MPFKTNTRPCSHGWSAGPTALLGKYVLGVAPTAPGFERFHVLPAFGGLSRASGRVPTPHGVISVAWRREDGTVTLEVDVPPNTHADIGLPAGEGPLLLDGNAVETQRQSTRRGDYDMITVSSGVHRLERP